MSSPEEGGDGGDTPVAKLSLLDPLSPHSCSSESQTDRSHDGRWVSGAGLWGSAETSPDLLAGSQ